MGTSVLLSAILERCLEIYELGPILMRICLFGGERLLVFLRENQHVALSQYEKLAVRLAWLGTEHASRNEYVPKQGRVLWLCILLFLT